MKKTEIIEQGPDLFLKFKVLEKLQTFFPIVLALSVLKTPFETKLYLNIIPPLVGLLFLLTFRKIEKTFYSLVLMLSLGIFVSSYHGDWKGVMRIGQVLCMIGFTCQVSNFSKKDYILFLKSLLIIFTLVYGLEAALGLESYNRKILGFNTNRYSGPVGEVNYSAIILAGMTLLWLYFSKWKAFLFSFILLGFSNSRTALLMMVEGSFGISFSSHRSIKKVVGYFNKILLALLFLTPLIIYLVNVFAPHSTKASLEVLSSGRFYLYVPYINMGLDNLLGIGYFRGWDNYHIFLEPMKELVDSIRGSQLNEQHNIFIQVFSEFGLIGYGFFIAFLYGIFKRIQETNELERERRLSLFVALLLGYSLLNGLNDMIFYFIIGLVINKNKLYE